MVKKSLGFNQTVDVAVSKNVIEKMFSPEFRNRLTETIFFNPLSHSIMEMIVDKFIDELNLQLASQNIRLEITQPAKQWLAEHGYSERYGARPLARLIQTAIRRPLSDEVLFGKLQDGGNAEVRLKGEKLVIQTRTS